MTIKQVFGSLNGGAVKPMVQAIIGVGIVAAILYCVIAGIDIPDSLWSIIGAVMGYYFGAIGKPNTVQVQFPRDVSDKEVKAVISAAGAATTGRINHVRD